MFVAQWAPKGSFAELVKVVTDAGLQRCLPALVECGARSLADVASCADALFSAGVPPSDVVTLVGLRAKPVATAQPLAVATVRSDIPLRRKEASASLQAALAAAEPQNRKRSLELVDQGLLAASSRAPSSHASGLGDASLRRGAWSLSPSPSSWSWRRRSKPAPTDPPRGTSTPQVAPGGLPGLVAGPVLRDRPLPVRATYSTPDRDRPTHQVPVLLLDVAGYPDVDAPTSPTASTCWGPFARARGGGSVPTTVTPTQCHWRRWRRGTPSTSGPGWERPTRGSSPTSSSTS